MLFFLVVSKWHKFVYSWSSYENKNINKINKKYINSFYPSSMVVKEREWKKIPKLILYIKLLMSCFYYNFCVGKLKQMGFGSIRFIFWMAHHRILGPKILNRPCIQTSTLSQLIFQGNCSWNSNPSND